MSRLAERWLIEVCDSATGASPEGVRERAGRPHAVLEAAGATGLMR
jgi:hypothetical protein